MQGASRGTFFIARFTLYPVAVLSRPNTYPSMKHNRLYSYLRLTSVLPMKKHHMAQDVQARGRDCMARGGGIELLLEQDGRRAPKTQAV
ncbi:hypothetical protein C8F01DRAFT_253760 [Mycena amicta]|nr:hypothetical protein C8F01DRAFT_253760 [Mycena amicta]